MQTSMGRESQYIEKWVFAESFQAKWEAPCPFPPVGSRDAGSWANGDIWATPLKLPW